MSNASVEVTLARLEEQVKSLQRDGRNQSDALRSGLEAISKNLADGIKDQSSLLKEALTSLRSEFVPKSEYNTVAFQVKFLWGAVTGLAVVVLSQVAQKILAGGGL